MTHELGHGLGLTHEDSDGDTPSYKVGNDPPCDRTNPATMCKFVYRGSTRQRTTRQRTLHPDDITGLSIIYPPKRPGLVQINLGDPLDDGDEDEESDWLKQSFAPVENEGEPNARLTLHFEVLPEAHLGSGFRPARSPLLLNVAFGDRVEIAVQLDEDDFDGDCFRYRVRFNGNVIYQQEFEIYNVATVRLFAEAQSQVHPGIFLGLPVVQ